LASGLQLIDKLCREMWEHVYPALDESEDNDPTFRMNALAPLADHQGLLADLRESMLVAARGMGACTVRQLEIALGILAPSGVDAQRLPSLSEIDAIAAAAQAQGSLAENRAQQAIDLVQGLQALLAERVGPTSAPNLQPLAARLRPLAEYLRKFASAPQDKPAQAAESTDGQIEFPSAAIAAIPARATGEIRSSQDAARLLDLICEYFEKHEPTNPAPLLLRRAQRLSTMNFYDIVRDIAPDALSSVDMVAGNRAET
jgi:type VI secretion system protein ImpA